MGVIFRLQSGRSKDLPIFFSRSSARRHDSDKALQPSMWPQTGGTL